MKQKKRRKIFGLALLSILLIMITIFFGLNSWTESILKKEHKQQEQIIGIGDKKALLIYQPSNGDTTHTISHEIAKILSENNYTITINTSPKNIGYDIDDYDLLVFGSPVYFGKVSPRIEDFISNNTIKNKNIIVFCTGKFIDEHKEEMEMKEWFDVSNNIYTLKTNKDEIDLLKKFMIRTLVNLDLNFIH